MLRCLYVDCFFFFHHCQLSIVILILSCLVMPILPSLLALLAIFPSVHAGVINEGASRVERQADCEDIYHEIISILPVLWFSDFSGQNQLVFFVKNWHFAAAATAAANEGLSLLQIFQVWGISCDLSAFNWRVHVGSLEISKLAFRTNRYPERASSSAWAAGPAVISSR